MDGRSWGMGGGVLVTAVCVASADESSGRTAPHLVQNLLPSPPVGVPQLVQKGMLVPQSISSPTTFAGAASCGSWPLSSAVALAVPSSTALCNAATVALADSKRSVW